MANMEILQRNRVDDASAITSNVGVLLPLANLQDPSPSVRTRLTGKTSVVIEVQLSGEIPYNIGTVCLVGTNLTPGATIIIQSVADGTTYNAGETITFGTSTTGFGAGGFGSGGFGGYPTPDEQQNPRGLVTFLRFSSPQNDRWWQFTFNDAANPDAFIEVGRINICEPFIPTINWTQLSYTPVDDSQTVVSDAGVLYSDARDVRRGVAFSFAAVSDAELFGQWSWLHQQLGGTPTEIIFTPAATTGAKTWLAIHGYFRDPATYTWWGVSEGVDQFSSNGLFFEEVF